MKYYFTYRGNGYGPYDTEDGCEAAALEKATFDYPHYTIWRGVADVKDQRLLKAELEKIREGEKR